jgi:hypothetical protein
MRVLYTLRLHPRLTVWSSQSTLQVELLNTIQIRCYQLAFGGNPSPNA